jgi:hypothetical protein
MAFLTLNFDLTSKCLVKSLNNSGLYLLPDIFQEDTLAIDLSVVQRISFVTPPFFSLVSLANYAMQISIGTAGTVNASQNTWTTNGDNTVFSGVLALNTAGINALADGASQIFEVRLLNLTSYNRGQAPVTYRKSVALAGALSIPPTDTALGKTEAAELYMPYELPAGRGITLVSADGTKKLLRYLDNDGTPREVNLT